MSIASIYQLRASTTSVQEQSKKEALRTSGRKKLGPEITASITAEEGHHCHEVREDLAQDKASRRITAHFFRAMISYHLECKTERGKTRLTGNHASCGKCESSHFSLTPDLKDDKLLRVIKQIPEEKLISPFKRKVTYLKHAGLSEEDIQFIECNHKDYALISQHILSIVSPTKANRSYAHTHFENQMNATFDNPRPSNIVDSRFERILRPKEDELCNKCTDKVITPEQSTKELVLSSVAYFQKSVDDLEKRKQELKTFLELNENLQKFIQENETQLISPDKYRQLIQNIEQILNLRSQLKMKLEGAPRIKNTDSYRQDYYTLKQIINNYYQVLEAGLEIDDAIAYFKSIQSTLKYHSDIVAEEKPIERLDTMLAETRHQLSINEFYIKNPGAIDQFLIMYFGISEKGGRRAPLNREIEAQLLEMMRKVEHIKRKALREISNLSPVKSGVKRFAPDEAVNPRSLKRINFEERSFEESNFGSSLDIPN